MDRFDHSLPELLAGRGFGRRAFLKYCAATAAALALPARYAGKIAHALQRVEKPVAVWLEFQECGGCTESLLRASDPSIDEILLRTLSLNYQSVLMAAAGHGAEAALYDTVARYKGQYVAFVEGAIPSGAGGFYAASGGRSALAIAREVCQGAAAVIAVGSCASFGGWPAARPNPTGAQGLDEAVPGLNLINLPGCPPNADNLTAALVHYLTFGALPPADARKRPLFAHGEQLHEQCERIEHYRANEFVKAWGDEGHRRGWCLLEMGCKGPETWHNCPKIGWNGGTSWPVAAGHGCIGCSEPGFWDAHPSFYTALPKQGGGGRGRR